MSVKKKLKQEDDECSCEMGHTCKECERKAKEEMRNEEQERGE